MIALYRKRCDRCRARIFHGVLPSGIITAFDAEPSTCGTWSVGGIVQRDVLTQASGMAFAGAAVVSAAHYGDECYTDHATTCRNRKPRERRSAEWRNQLLSISRQEYQMTILRQGDVAIIRTTPKTKIGKRIEREGRRIILARGEATGHHHAIADGGAELHALSDTDDRFLKVMAASGVTLTHQEHAPVLIPPGDYVVRIQREYGGKDLPALRVVD